MENTKTVITKKAHDMLWAKGYDGASINDIVTGASVSKGAFFHYYPNKRAVTLDVLQKYMDLKIYKPMDKFLSSSQNIKESIFMWLQEMFVGYEKRRYKNGCMLGNFALELADQDEQIRQVMATHFLEWENRLVGYLRPLHAEGRLQMEPRQLARLIISAIQGSQMGCKVHKDKIRASREFQALAQLVEIMIKD